MAKDSAVDKDETEENIPDQCSHYSTFQILYIII